MAVVPVQALWLPIVVSTVFVFLASWILHVLVPFHRNDLRRFAREDEVMDVLRPFAIPPGDYAMPLPASMAAMKDPAFTAKMEKGPVAFVTVRPAGPPNMAKPLGTWFVFCLVVSAFTAYVTGHALPAGPGLYRAVFRIAGCMAFASYGLALVSDSIWYGRNWGTTVKSLVDAVIYGALTAGTFGWLWPL